jgi:hypothetical protein
LIETGRLLNQLRSKFNLELVSESNISMLYLIFSWIKSKNNIRSTFLIQLKVLTSSVKKNELKNLSLKNQQMVNQRLLLPSQSWVIKTCLGFAHSLCQTQKNFTTFTTLVTYFCSLQMMFSFALLQYLKIIKISKSQYLRRLSIWILD